MFGAVGVNATCMRERTKVSRAVYSTGTKMGAIYCWALRCCDLAPGSQGLVDQNKTHDLFFFGNSLIVFSRSMRQRSLSVGFLCACVSTFFLESLRKSRVLFSRY